MSYTAKEGDGALFKNDNRKTDKHPNATGYVIAHRNIRRGEKLNLAAWTKDGKSGKFQSLRMSDTKTGFKKQDEEDDKEIPF